MENPDQCKTQNKARQEIDQGQIDQQQVLLSFRQIFPLLDTPLSCTQYLVSSFFQLNWQQQRASNNFVHQK
ncbi:hypothetical protein E2320_009411, partial [Naja naja]